MTPRNRKAIAFLAKHFNIESERYNPIAFNGQAEDIAKRLDLHVSYGHLADGKGGYSQGNPNGWMVRRTESDEEPIYMLTGMDENEEEARNEAVVMGACLAIDENWEEINRTPVETDK